MSHTKATHWSLWLRRMRACEEAVKFAMGHESLEAAWAACERADWMLWLVGRTADFGPAFDARRRPLVACSVACARLVLPVFEKRRHGDLRVRDALDTLDRWARGEASDDEGRQARAAADAAAYAAAATAADAAAYATTTAADAAAHAAYATAAYDAAAYAAYAYAYAADAAAAAADADAAYAYAYATAAYAYAADAAAAAAYADRSSMRRQCADIVRQHFTCPTLTLE